MSIFYKQPDLIFDYELKLEDFSDNTWRVYWQIAYDIVIKENKPILDEITIGLYLEKHLKLKQKYEEYGGYETIEKAKEYIKTENIDGYIKELHKWITVLMLLKYKFPIADRISEFADMSIDDIYSEYDSLLNHIFVNSEGNIESYNACEGINQLIDRMNEGQGVGLPFHNCDILNKEIGGFNINGNIIGIGAASGVGKSTMAINYIIPSLIKYDEKAVFFINEEDHTKVQRELITYCANNIFKQELPKYKLRDGKFDEETMALLRKCAEWIEEKKENRNITIVPLEKYSAEIVIKLIKKYNSAFGVRIFVLDTLKESFDAKTDDIFKSMMRDMVKFYDVVKPSAKNVGLLVTYQLNKASIKQRYLTNNEIGQAKSILDVMSVNLMMRRPMFDEYEGCKKEIVGYRLEGKNGKTKIPFKLSLDKHYMITFIPKNRFGQTDAFQIISEFDLSRNVFKDIGICNIEQDW